MNGVDEMSLTQVESVCCVVTGVRAKTLDVLSIRAPGSP